MYNTRHLIAKAFTLIELLVVIAIIALLMSIVMPGLNMAKKKAASAVCLVNAKNLSLAWYAYQEENNGTLVGGWMSRVDTNGRSIAWMRRPLHVNGTDFSDAEFKDKSVTVTDEDEIRGIEAGKLYPYMETPDAYHCPADKLRKGPDRTRMFTSYAMAACLDGAKQNLVNKFTDITSPSDRYNFVESGERNRGHWTWEGAFYVAVNATSTSVQYGLSSPVAISHGNSNIFGFADGHAENHKWHEQIIFNHYYKTENQYLYGVDYPKGSSDDVNWLGRGWALRP
jgi:prepilin-type N-terminal cleavage/methylation domain-containing protein/prepilin-type processing-associated H-X9-DG protein